MDLPSLRPTTNEQGRDFAQLRYVEDWLDSAILDKTVRRLEHSLSSLEEEVASALERNIARRYQELADGQDLPLMTYRKLLAIVESFFPPAASVAEALWLIWAISTLDILDPQWSSWPFEKMKRTLSRQLEADEPLVGQEDAERLLVQQIASQLSMALDLKNRSARELKALVGEAESAMQLAQESEYLWVPAMLAYQAIRETIVDPDAFNAGADGPWPTAPVARKHLHGEIQLRSLDRKRLQWSPDEREQIVREVWETRAQMNDLDADALDMLSALWLERRPSTDEGLWVKIDDLLRMRGLKPRNGGSYRMDQRRAMIEAITRLAMHFIELEVQLWDTESQEFEPKWLKSRLFVISGVFGPLTRQHERTEEVEGFFFHPGPGYRPLLKATRQQSLLSKKALSFPPDNFDWEKRLTRFFSWTWSLRKATDQWTHVHRISDVLERLRMRPNRKRPQRTLERFETAMCRIRTEGVIEDWEYETSVRMRGRGWLNEWLSAKILVRPPTSIQMQLETSQAVDAELSAPVSLGYRIQKKRKKLKLRQQDVADDLNISRSYLSMIERGQQTPSRNIRDRISDWLREAG